MTDPFTCGIVVPVRDEESTLRETVPALLAAANGENACIVWVCNGCRDDSAGVIRRLGGPQARVVELPTPGKTAALQAGDEALDAQAVFPRLYLDADTLLRPGDVENLLRPLRAREADLVAAAHAFDCSRASRVSTAIARCWLALPFARENAFLGAVAISADGRRRWDRWPGIIADDMFMAAHIPAERRRMVPDAVATTRPPATFGGWIRMRSRWLRGERQLRALGLQLPASDAHRRALLRRCCHPRLGVGVLAFLLVRLLAMPLAWFQAGNDWRPDRPA